MKGMIAGKRRALTSQRFTWQIYLGEAGRIHAADF
jgi:hypothetical protein